jgi:Domain of unknown function (DUF4055)
MISITDPSLPSYQSPIYQQAINDWNFVGDMYKGRQAWINVNGRLVGNKAGVYLPCEPDELSESYHNRLLRSSFQRRYGNAIDAFAGMLSRFSVTGILPKQMLENIENVDRLGNSLAKFLIQADIAALRDGICYIFVDFPERPMIEGREMNFLEEQQLKLRPFLTLYEASQVKNLQISSETQEIELASIQELTWEKSGRFGSDLVERYRVLTPSGGELYRVIDDQDNPKLILEKEWTSTAEKITLVPYTIGIGSEGLFGVTPPLIDLALLNLKHYQKESEKDELMHKCNIPILQINRPNGLPKTVSTGTSTAKKEDPKITIGPNTVLFNVEARYVEPTGAALSLTIQDLKDLEAAMTQKTLDFLSLGDVAKTATEIVHSAAPLSASLAGMMVAKETAVQTIFDYWAIFSDGQHDASIQIDEGDIRSTLNAGNIDRLMTLRQNGDLSQRTFLDLIQEARVLPTSVNIEQEITAIKSEKPTGA